MNIIEAFSKMDELNKGMKIPCWCCRPKRWVGYGKAIVDNKGLVCVYNAIEEEIHPPYALRSALIAEEWEVTRLGVVIDEVIEEEGDED